MIAVAWWQALLNALGWFLSHVYDGVHNYGLAIILLTLGIRLVLLPLGLKQIRSMQAMQAIQPQVKGLQQKYKGNKQKLNEEMMKLYKERGVNPLAGCLPMLLQIPVLIALYSVLRFPQHPPHLPAGSELQHKIQSSVTSVHPGNPANFLSMNLLCNAQQAGTQVRFDDNQSKETIHLDCGHGIPVRIPYYVLGLLMVGTMYYQQRQMMKAAPPGASPQQQALTRIMPLISIFWGFVVPAGVILYWTTSNLVQIGQQHFLLRAGHIGEPVGGDGAKKAEGAGKKAGSGSRAPVRRGFFASMLDRAEAERARRQGDTPPGPTRAERPPEKRSSSSGGGNARSRKKRRKR